MPCPACRENGSDKSGEHLTVFPSGKFACAVHPSDKEHNRRIIELRPDLGTPPTPFAGKKKRELGPVVEKYSYHDQSGQEIYQVWRHDPKDFSQHRIIDGEARPTLEGIARVPYRLPEVLKSETVWIVEGEKDADSLAALDIVATCNAGGAGKWKAEWTRFFEGKHVVICGDNDAPGRKHVEQVAAMLADAGKSVRHVEIPAPAKDITDFLEGMSDTEALAAIEELLRQPDPLDALLDARRFDLATPPLPARSIYRIGTATIATPGNLVVIAAQAKAGKSALVGAFIAAATGMDGDTLGIASGNPDGRALVHFDTEQSPADHHALVATALRRVRADQPAWLRSYRLADVSTKERFQLLQHELDRARQDHGGIHSALLDGIADFVADPNDSAEAFAAVDKLHRLAVQFDTTILCVLHFNPGSEFNKTRGHLGSQLERKAETNLALEKVDGITVAYTKLARHAHIEKDAGARFQWDAAAGMHLSCGTIQDEKENAKAQEIIGILAQVFTAKPLLAYGELRTAIMQIRGITQRPAEKYIASLQPKFIHQTASGLYGVKP
jgi:5S rRNA maturation endonuclease (ribonuclease M5)